MTELEKMLAGEMHDITDPEVSRLNREARRKLEKLNATSWLDTVRYTEALTELIPDRAPSSVLITPFFCDYGFRIRLGEKVYINANCTFSTREASPSAPTRLSAPTANSTPRFIRWMPPSGANPSNEERPSR